MTSPPPPCAARPCARQELAARPELRARLVEIYKLGGALSTAARDSDVRRPGGARAVATLAQLDRARVNVHQRTLAANSRRRQSARGSGSGRSTRSTVTRPPPERPSSGPRKPRTISSATSTDGAISMPSSPANQAAQQKLQATLRAARPRPRATLTRRDARRRRQRPVPGPK